MKNLVKITAAIIALIMVLVLVPAAASAATDMTVRQPYYWSSTGNAYYPPAAPQMVWNGSEYVPAYYYDDYYDYYYNYYGYTNNYYYAPVPVSYVPSVGVPSATLSGTGAILNVTASAPAGSVLSCQWQQLSGGVWYDIPGAISGQYYYQNLSAGTYTVRSVVYSNYGYTVVPSASVSFTVPAAYAVPYAPVTTTYTYTVVQQTAGDYLTCCVKTLNLRAGPGTGYDKVGALHMGDTVSVAEHLSNGWVRLLTDGGYSVYAYTDWGNYLR